MDVGANVVILSAHDVNGNVDSCAVTVTVLDTISPIALCQDMVLQLDQSGNATLSAGDIDNGSNDNCSIASLVVDRTTFTTSDLGANTVTLTVNDVNGNSTTCTSVVTVQDTLAPVALCRDVIVYLNAGGQMTITADTLDNGSFDNDGIASLAVSSDSFTCTDIGPNEVTLTVTDVNDNTMTCTAVVTVLDTVPPASICQDITVYLDTSGVVSIDDADLNGGSTDACGIASFAASKTDFDCGDVGTSVVSDRPGHYLSYSNLPGYHCNARCTGRRLNHRNRCRYWK